MPRLVQQSATGPLVALFFCGDGFPSHRTHLLDAIGRDAHVLALDSDSSHDEAMRAALAPLRAADPARQLIVAGYSAGGHRVRDVLDIVRPGDVVVTADATHASFEQRPQTMPIGPWLALAERAERSEVRWLSSHTYLTYVEHLPPSEGPYYSTATVMRRCSRLLLPEPEAAGGSIRNDVGGLAIWSYESGSADSAAHRRQLVEVMPLLLAEARQTGGYDALRSVARLIVDPFVSAFERLYAALAGRAPTRGEIALARVRACLELGVAEVAGPKSNPIIRDMLAGCVRGGKPVGLSSDETDWCAACASWSALGPAKDGLGAGAGAPHEWRCAVHELVEDARATGAFHDVSTGYTPSPGDLAIYARAGEDPRKGGRGHVARVESVTADGYTTIGGNEGNAVRRTERLRADPSLVGWIAY